MFQIDILKYCLTDLRAFRLRKDKIRQIIGSDVSMQNIYKIIHEVAFDPKNKNVKSVAISIFADMISKNNKYYQPVIKYDAKESEIKDLPTLDLAIEQDLKEVRVEQIKIYTEKIVEAIYTNNDKLAKDHVKAINQNIVTNVEDVTIEDVENELRVYYDNITASRVEIGYKKFDEVIEGGIRKGQIITLVGETGLGKTWLISNLIQQMSISNKVALLTNEMTRGEMYIRLAAIQESSSETAVENKGLGFISKYISEQCTNIIVYDRCYTVERIEAIVKKVVEETETWIFVLDHFHNLYNSKKDEGESQAFTAHELQRIAQEYGVTFIIAAQLAKAEYGNKKGTPKGRADLMEVSNAVFSLLIEEEKQKAVMKDDKKSFTHNVYVKDKRKQRIITVNPIKIRRGYRQTFYLLQDFEMGGIITEIDL